MPRRTLLLLLLLALPSSPVPLLAGTSDPAQNQPSRLTLTAPPAKSRWVEVTPVGSGPAGKVFTLQDDARTVVLEGIAPGLDLLTDARGEALRAPLTSPGITSYRYLQIP